MFPPTQPRCALRKSASSKSIVSAPVMLSGRQVWPPSAVRATKPFHPAIQAVVALTAVMPLIAITSGAPTVCASSPISPRRGAEAIQRSLGERGAMPCKLYQVGIGACFVQRQKPASTRVWAKGLPRYEHCGQNRNDACETMRRSHDFFLLICPGDMKSQGAGILASDTKGVACSIDLGRYFLALASVPDDAAMLV